MAVGVRLTNGMFNSTPPTGVHRAAGTVESAGLSRWIVNSYLGLRLLKLEGKSCTQGPCHDWSTLHRHLHPGIWECHLILIGLLLCFRKHRTNFT